MCKGKPCENLTSLLRYSLRGEDAGSFLIDTETGEVRTRWSLDREEQAEYLLEVIAEDQGQDVALVDHLGSGVLPGVVSERFPRPVVRPAVP